MAGENSNNINNIPQIGGNFDSNTANVNQRMFSSLTTNLRHVIARSAHSDTLEVGGYDPDISRKLSEASAQNDNFNKRIELNNVAKQLLTDYGIEFDIDIETAYHNFKNGIPSIPGLETRVIFMGCVYKNEPLGRLKIISVPPDNIDNSGDTGEVIAILSGDEAKYELRNRAEIYYDTVSRTVPTDYVMEEYKSEIN